MKAVPLPGVLSTATLPRSARTASRTTSRPTPRPDSSLTVSRVEKPGSKIRLTTRGSSAGVPVGTMPSAIPFLHDLLAVQSPPVVLDPDRDPVPLVAGRERDPPEPRLPFLDAVPTDARARGRRRCGSGESSGRRAARRSCGPVASPDRSIRSSISLPDRSARSRTTRGNREKSSSTGTIRRSRVVSRICRLTRCSASSA